MESVAEKKVIRKKLARILPYLDGKSDNMGLAKYGERLLPGVKHTEYLACLEHNGVPRYLTGLNEYAPEVQGIAYERKRVAVIKEIRQKVAFLERSFGANVIDPDDKDFWNKVKTVHPANNDYWKNVYLDITNEPRFLDETDPVDLIHLCAIKAGGYSGIAKSFEDARISSISPKFYLDEESQTAITTNELRKLKNKAKAALQELMEEGGPKLFYVTKEVDINSARYTNSTSAEVMYGFLDDYIEGKGTLNAKQAATHFNKVVKMSIEDLKIKAVVSDATFFKFIQKKADQRIYHTKTDVMLGGTVEEVFEFLKNPMNGKLAAQLISEVEARWKL